MLLFLIVLFPISILFFFLSRKESGSSLLTVFIGFFTAAILCAYKTFFSSSYHLPVLSFFGIFSYMFFTQIFLPITILFVLFCILTRKDTIAYRFANFFPLMTGFYSVYLPYITLNTELPYSFYHIFIKPLLFLAMLYLVSCLLRKILEDIVQEKKSKKIFRDGVLILLAMMIPALVEVLWVMKTLGIVWAIITLAYLLFVFSVFKLSLSNTKRV